MKKIILIAVIAFAAHVCFGQINIFSEIDEFTGGKVVITSWERLNLGNGMTGHNHIYFRFRYENNMEYFHFKWVTGDILSISQDDEIMFKMDDASILKLHALSYTIAATGEGSVGKGMAAMIGINVIYIGEDVRKFTEKPIIEKIRIYTNSGYVNINIKPKHAAKVNEAYRIFVKEINK